jgi:hypothetical protein
MTRIRGSGIAASIPHCRSARREVHPPAAINLYIVTTAAAVKLPLSGSPARSHADAEGRSKQVRANMTINDMEPHWEAVVDYGAFEVSIPLPARYQKDADVDTQTHEFVEAMESLAKALLGFADQTRIRWLDSRD